MPDILKYDVLVIGSLNADLVVRVKHFPLPGETISGDDLQIIPGGKGANQAVAAARQGARVAMIGCVGKDGFGSFLLDSLNSNNVDTSHVRVDESSTGTATIIVESNGQNSIVLSSGANGKVSAKDIEAFKLDAKILLLQLEIPLEIVIHAAQWGRQKGMTVILNPAPASELPAELLSNTDYIIPNETELDLLSGVPVIDISSAEQAAKVMIDQGAKNVIVTLGDRGALFVSSNQVAYVEPYKINVIDTTAAGDAFIGGFASALLRGVENMEAVKYANACGALAATKFGAQPSLPTKEKLEKFIS